MDGTDKISEMVGEVVEDGKTVLLDEKPAEITEPGQPEAEAKEPDPLNLDGPKPDGKPAKSDENTEKFDIGLLMSETEGEAEPDEDPATKGHAFKKLRNRAQAAEAREAEKDARIAELESAKATDDPYADLGIEDPDDLVDGRTVAKLVQQGVKQGIKQYHDALQSQSQATESKAAQKEAYNKSFDVAREKYADFDKVTTEAHKNGYISDQELAEVANSKNPAALLYAKATERLKILGNPTSVTGNNQPANELLDPAPAKDTDKEMGIYEVMLME